MAEQVGLRSRRTRAEMQRGYLRELRVSFVSFVSKSACGHEEHEVGTKSTKGKAKGFIFVIFRSLRVWALIWLYRTCDMMTVVL
jgi:hypothetical protein